MNFKMILLNVFFIFFISCFNIKSFAETMSLDTSQISTNSISSIQILEENEIYLLTVKGTVSIWSSNSWYTICAGTPENEPMYESLNNNNGKTGVDAAYLFASVSGSPYCDAQLPIKEERLKISLDDGNSWFTPNFIEASYNPNHSYTFFFQGKGHSLKAKYVDEPDTDNYGVIQLLISKYEDCSSIIKGDHNDNNIIDLGDAIGILKSLSNPRSITGYPLSCNEILTKDNSKGDGYYIIDPDGSGELEPFEVFCDMQTDGGGWTRIEYKKDLELKSHFSGEDAYRFLPENFETVLSPKEIEAIQEVSNEGKQLYVGECIHVLHYYYPLENTFMHAFGYKFLNGYETDFGKKYTDIQYEIIKDDCKNNDDVHRATQILIRDVRVPIINVKSYDTGESNEKFGSKLTENPAWLR